MSASLSKGLLRAALGTLGLAIGLGLAAWIAAPRVSSLRPTATTSGVPSSAAVRLTFSREMDRDSVERALRFSPPATGSTSWRGRTLTFVPDRLWPSKASVEVRLEGAVRSEAGLPLWGRRSWSFATGVPRLAYLWPSEGPAELYLTPEGHAQSVPVTETSQGVIEFSLGDYGCSLVYAAAAEGGADFYLLDLTTGDHRLVYRCPPEAVCGSPALSWDGRWLAFEQAPLREGPGEAGIGVGSQIQLLAIAGGTPETLSDEGRLAMHPVWASDGKLAYYDGALRATVVLSDLSNGGRARLAVVPNDFGITGVWAPDSRYLVFPELIIPEAHADDADAGAEGPEGFFYSHLMRAEVPSIALRDLSAVSGDWVEDASPAISPEGEWLAFARKELAAGRWTLGRQLWLARADGTEARRLLDEPAYNHSSIQWSPDGSSLAYMRLDQASPGLPPQIWVYDMAQGTAALIVEGGFQPRWIP